MAVCIDAVNINRTFNGWKIPEQKPHIIDSSVWIYARQPLQTLHVQGIMGKGSERAVAASWWLRQNFYLFIYLFYPQQQEQQQC